MNPPLLYTQMTLRPGFDGLIFVRDTAPTTATAGALVVAGDASGAAPRPSCRSLVTHKLHGELLEGTPAS